MKVVIKRSNKELKNEGNIYKESKECLNNVLEKKSKNIIIDILQHNILFILGIVILLYKGILLNYMIGLEIKIEMVMYALSASLLIMCPVINHKDKFGYIYLNITYTIVTLIIYADYLYYTYATNFLSLYQLENLKYSKEIASGIFCIIDIKQILIFFIDNIAIIFYGIFTHTKFRNSYYNHKILKTIIIIIIIILNIYVIKSKINGIYSSKGYNKSLIVQDASIYYYHYEDAKDYIFSLTAKEKINQERIEDIYVNIIDKKEKQTQYTGFAKECNVIILQLESLNEYVINKKINGKEITPNLNKFFNENIYCSDMYNQGMGTTADSEFEMENSLYPLENGYVFQKYYNNEWLDIFSELRRNGYYTSFMHPNTSTFWNREEVYKKGYNIDEYNDINMFQNIERAGEFYSDEGFLTKAIDIMSNYENKFCTTLVSVTTHIPFYLDGISNLHQKLTITQEDLNIFEDETYKNYLLSCNFVDYAFGKFLEGIENEGFLENSILIVYGDHGAGISTESDIKKLYNDNNLEYTEFEEKTKGVHIPFGIKIPNMQDSINIRRSVSKIDIKPTILDLLGIKDSFSIGRSIFTNKDYSFIKGLGFITSRNFSINEKYYNRNTLEEIEQTQEMYELQKQMEEEIYFSDTIIKNNLLKELDMVHK